MIVPLQLRHDATADAAPAAWFLPGDSAETWLAELTRCGLAELDTRLFVVPRSVSDRSTAGLLVIPPGGTTNRLRPRGIACRAVAGECFAPADGALFPPVTEAELRALLPLPVTFFHPTFGLSAFEEESTLRVADLIDVPGERPDNWNLARPGAPPLARLEAVVLATPPSIHDIFGGAEKDIASERPAKLPPAPNEPKDDALTKSKRSLRRWLAKSMSAALRHVPRTAGRQTWANNAADWAQRQLEGIHRQLEELRHKELRRLLHMLDHDPEAGLRHAIPMNQFPHRGLAPSGARLTPRSPDFSPSRLGGGPADFWNAPGDLQEKLRQRYREMADRELRLGRHRRAAYIYAELLGDLTSAAQALRAGRWWQEAALLYEEKLNNPGEAAVCLAEGGFWLEAVERFAKLGRWLDVADLQEKLGNQTAAREALERVVQQFQAKGDVLAAAKLVAERLQLPDRALEMLFATWPDSSQSVLCLNEAFGILRRLGRHDAVLERVVRLGRESAPQGRIPQLLNVLSRLAREYPTPQVRHRAADLSRVLIAGRLKAPGLGLDEMALVAQHLVELVPAPKDRLVGRDVNRFLSARRAAEVRARTALPPPKAGNRPVVEYRLQLPRHIEWLQLRSEWHWFYALGVTPKQLLLVRGVWDAGTYGAPALAGEPYDNPKRPAPSDASPAKAGTPYDAELQILTWNCSAVVVRNAALIFEPTGERGDALALAIGDRRLEPKHFPACDGNQRCSVAVPPCLPMDAGPFAFGDDSIWAADAAAGRTILSCYDKRGNTAAHPGRDGGPVG